MRLLVFGQTGQVARELARRLPLGVTARFLGRAEADLMRPDQVRNAILSAGADAVVNAAAWTAVDLAETQEAAATVVNGASVGAMARACAETGLPFLTISTDYVFDGAGTRPFRPADPVGPLGAYGRSKLVGERLVAKAGGHWLILRTSWVVSAFGTNFVKTMLRLGHEREVLRVVADQVGGPTPAAALADALIVAAQAMVAGAPGGIQHFAGAPDASWADLARTVMAGAGLACRIEEIPSEAYPAPARRPRNSRLDCSEFERSFGISRPQWRPGVAAILRELST